MKKARKQVKPQQKYSTKIIAPPMQKGNAKSYFTIAAMAVISLLGIIIYSNSFDCTFHFDDFNNIVENEKIRDLADVNSWWSYNATRPVAFFTFALNYHFDKLEVQYWHLFNLVIHIIASYLVYWFTILIFSTPFFKDQKMVKHAKELALFTALLFVSHPLATQSVTYIVQRMSSMAAMFYLFSLVLYLKARISEKGAVQKILMFSGSFIAAVLAMLTKENAFTIPFAVILVEFFFIRTKRPLINFKDYRVILFMAILATLVLIVPLRYSLNIFDDIPLSLNHGRTYTVTPVNYLLTQFSVIIKYLQLLIIPVNQVVDYDYPVSNSLFEIRTMFGLLFLICLFVLALYLYKRSRVISFGIFWFFLTLSIESSIIPITDVIFEHRTYLPSVGFFMILTFIIFQFLWERHKIYAVALLAVIIVSNGYLTYQRNKVWKDELTLWTDNIEKAPGCARAYYNRARAFAILEQWDKAREDCSRAIEINPKYMLPYFGRGDANESLLKYNEAIRDYTKTIGLDSNYVQAYLKRGIIYGKIKEWEQAIPDFNKVIMIDSTYTEAIFNRGIAFMNTGDFKSAGSDFSRVISLDPRNAIAYNNRGIIHRYFKDLEMAISDYSDAIRVNPQYINAYFNRGNAYFSLQKWDQAIKDYSLVLNLDQNNKDAYNNREIALKNLKGQH